jgi:hypothetical protein
MRPVAVKLQSFNLGGPTVTPGMLSAFAPMARIDLVAAPRRRNDKVIAAIQIEPLSRTEQAGEDKSFARPSAAFALAIRKLRKRLVNLNRHLLGRGERQWNRGNMRGKDSCL